MVNIVVLLFSGLKSLPIPSKKTYHFRKKEKISTTSKPTFSLILIFLIEVLHFDIFIRLTLA